MTIVIRAMTAEDMPVLVATKGGAAWNGGAEKWTGYLADQISEQRIVLLAARGSAILGYGSLLWVSGYPPFRNERIPEIKDVVVAERERRCGVGTALISALEERAGADGYARIGIAVGLYGDYGPAQRLYVRRGFIPDGRGMTYGGSPTPGGVKVKVDDDLLLWLVKSLRTDAAR